MTQNSNLDLFLKTRCEMGVDFLVEKQNLYQAYLTFSIEHGDEFPLSRALFGRELSLLGVMDFRTKRARCLKGVRLLAQRSAVAPSVLALPTLETEKREVWSPKGERLKPEPLHYYFPRNDAVDALLLRALMGEGK